MNGNITYIMFAILVATGVAAYCWPEINFILSRLEMLR